MPTDLLGPLGDEPVPPLAPAAVVRARGEQRSRRRRAALAGATALTLALVGGVGIALGVPSGTDALRPEPYATSGTPDATPSPVPDPTAEAPRVTPQQLLDGPSVEAVLGGSWSTLPDLREVVHLSTFPCPEGPPAAVAGLTRGLESADGQRLGQEVLAFADVATAADLHAQLRADVQRCPTRPEDSEDGRATASHELLTRLQGVSDDRFYLRTASRDCDDCPERAGVVAVARVGLWLVLIGGSTELEPDLPGLADAAVARAGGTSPTSTADPSARDWFLPDAFLPPVQAAEAELPGWMIQDSHAPDDITSVADPCQEGTLPLADQIRDQGEQAMGSEREAGGSSLLQEVYGYSSATTAEQAFAEYEQRYTRCASVQDPNASEGWTIRSAVVEDTGARVVVRRIPCSPEAACAEHFSTYVFLVRVADAVTVVAYTIAEDGDPAEEARALAAAVERRLREAVIG